MAATITMYDEFHYLLGNDGLGAPLTSTGKLKMVFLDATTSPVLTNATVAAVIAASTASTGYTRPTLHNVTLTRDATNHRAILDADDVVVTDAGGFSANRACLYWDPTATGDSAGSADSACIPIASIYLDDSGTKVNPDTNGTLTVSWNATGILAI